MTKINIIYRWFAYISMVMLMFAVVLPVSAQTEETVESLPETTVEDIAEPEIEDKSDIVDFDPVIYQNQNRYSPRENDSLFFKRSWLNGFYAGVAGGVMNMTDKYANLTQPNLAAYIGYRFTPIHSLRFMASKANFKQLQTDKTLKSVAFELDYLASLSNFASGYNPMRVMDWSTVLGAGARMTSGSPDKLSPYFLAGLHIAAHPASNFAIFFEPYAGVIQHQPYLFNREVPSKYNLFYGAYLGAQYNMESAVMKNVKYDPIYRTMFVDVTYGFATQHSDGGFLRMGGSQWQMAVGQWFNPILGLRGSLSLNQRYSRFNELNYGDVTYRRYKPQVSALGRAEFMFDPINIFKEYREKPGGHTFDLNILVGGGIGYNVNTALSTKGSRGTRNYFYDLTGAIQALYRVSPKTYIFLEPRYDLLINHFTNDRASNAFNKANGLPSLSMGTRVYRNTSEERMVQNRNFDRHFWVAADLGAVKQFRYKSLRKSTGWTLQPSVTGSVGYDLAPLASFRLSLNYQRLNYTSFNNYKYMSGKKSAKSSAMFDKYYNVVDARLAYMLNVNNLLQKHDADRRVNLYAIVGPTLTYVLSQKNNPADGAPNGIPSDVGVDGKLTGRKSVGIHGGFMPVFRMNNHWDLTVEALGQYNVMHSPSIVAGTNPKLDNMSWSLSVGSRYHLIQYNDSIRALRNIGIKPWQKGWMYEIAYGAVLPLGRDGNLGHLSGNSWSVRFGRWINSIVGARLGIYAQDTYWRELNHKNYTSYSFRPDMGVRGELMFDVLNMSRRFRMREVESPWGLNIATGFNAGEVGYYHAKRGKHRAPYMGFVGSLQALYRVAPGAYIFVEPSIMAANSKNDDTYFGQKQTERFVNINAGARIMRPYGTYRKQIQDDNVFNSFYRNMWLGLNLGGLKTMQCAKVPSAQFGVNPTIGLSLGYDLNPLASFRLQAENQHLSVNTGSGDTKYGKMDFRMIYMLNTVNLWQRTRRLPRLSIYLEAGPTWSIVTKQNNGPAKDIMGNNSLGVMTGLMAAYRINRTWDLTIESMGQYNFKYMHNPVMPVVHRVRPSQLETGLNMGVRYHILPHNDSIRILRNIDVKPWQKGWMYEIAYGAVLPLGVEGNLGHLSGNSWNVRFGRWINSIFGLRLGVYAQESFWREQKGKDYNSYSFRPEAGVSGEMIFDVLSMSRAFRQRNYESPWGLNFATGLNVGRSAYYHTKSNHYNAPNLGISASLQGLYRVAPGAYVFVEPRVISAQSKDKENASNNTKSEMFMNINAGARIMRPYGTYRKQIQDDNVLNSFSRNIWVGLDLGGLKMLRCSKVPSGMGINPTIGLNLGYDLNPLASFRLQAENQQFSHDKGKGVTKYGKMDFRMIYMLNTVNLWQNTRRTPRLSIYWEAGPTWSVVTKQNNGPANDIMGNNSLGVMTGLMAAYRITRTWDLTIESMGQYNFKYMHNPVMPVSHRVRPSQVETGLNMGVRYHILPHNDSIRILRNIDVRPWQKGWMYEIAYGAVLPLGEDGNLGHMSGNSWNVRFGRWINAVMGLRLGVYAQETYWREQKLKDHNSYSFRPDAGVRGELLFDVLNMSRAFRNRYYESPWGLNFAAGLSAGRAVYYHTPKGRYDAPYMGISASLQALYRVAPGAYLFVEPSVMQATSKDKQTANNDRKNEMFMNINAGARIMRPYGTYRKQIQDDHVLNSFTRNMWVGLDLGGLKTLRCAKVPSGNLGISPTIGLNLGYDLNPLASFRLQAENQHFSIDKGNGSTKYGKMDFRLIYMLNTVNLWQNTRRTPRLSIYWEVGPTWSVVTNQSKGPAKDIMGNNSLGVMTGLMAAYRLNRTWDLTIESMGQYNLKYKHNPVMPVMHRVRPSQVETGLNIGVRYHIMPQKDSLNIFRDLKLKSWQKGWMYEVAYGAALPLGVDGNLAHLSGNSWNVRLGRWINSIVGIRLGLYAQTSYWREQELKNYTTYSFRPEMGVRGELMFDVLNLSRAHRMQYRESPWGLNFSAGLNAGKAGIYHSTKHESGLPYYGLSTSLQALYRVAPGAYLFVEPAMFTAMSKSKVVTSSYRDIDRMFNIYAGARVVRGDRYARTQLKNDDAKSAFRRNAWLGLEVGGLKMLRCGKIPSGKLGINPTVSLSLGYDFTPLSTVRLQAENQHISLDRGQGATKYGKMDFRMIYMLNTVNLWQGTRRNPRLSIYWEAGPTWSVVTRQDDGPNKDIKGNNSMGLMTGLMAAYRVGKSWDITAESMGQYNFKYKHNPVMPVSHRVRPSQVELGFNIGTRYHMSDISKFRSVMKQYATKSWNKGVFVETSYGWMLPVNSGIGIHSTGSSWNASLGHWFNELLGARVGFHAQQGYWKNDPVAAKFDKKTGAQLTAAYDNYKAFVLGGGRVEAIFNPLALAPSRKYSDLPSRFDMNVSAGIDFGVNGYTHSHVKRMKYVGFTTSLQTLYRVSKGVQMFFEPRYMSASSSRTRGKYNMDVTHRSFSMNVGARITRPTGARVKDDDKHVIAFTRRPWMTLNIGGMKSLQCDNVSTGGLGIEPSIGVSAGYDLTALSSFRLQATYNKMDRMLLNQKYTTTLADGTSKMHKGQFDTDLHQLDLRLMYVLNVTNLWRGTRNLSPLNVYWQVGPSFSANMKQNTAMPKDVQQPANGYDYKGKDYSGKVCAGLATGIFATYRVASHWDLLVETNGQLLGSRTFIPSWHKRVVSKVKTDFSIGTRYNF